jgi:glycosyltransferase involved in cell wall biosynthesis
MRWSGAAPSPAPPGAPEHATPFFVAPGPGAARRLLLVSYHFPPGSAVGALRWQKTAGFAAERGWSLDVVTVSPDQAEAPDFGRLADLPPGTRVFGVPRREPWWSRLEDGLRRRLRRAQAAAPGPPAAGTPRSTARGELRWWPRSLRDLLRWRDAVRLFGIDGRWARAAARLGEALARRHRYALCITSGPPHMTHEAGRHLRRRLGLPHVVDMRDPWSLVEQLLAHFASPVWYVLARRHERRVVATASLVVMNTPAAAAAMRRAYPAAADRVLAVPNGFDEEEIPQVPRDPAFVVAYAGTIYLDRDPAPLVRALARLVRERNLKPGDVRLEFMGLNEGGPIDAIAAAEGVAGFVRWRPPTGRRTALEFMAGASLLVSLFQTSRLIVPAKVYEYMLFDAWILALAQPESATAELLANTDADVVPPDDPEALFAVLSRRYAEHAAGVRPRPLARHARFGRRAQADALLDAVDRVVVAEPSGAPASAGA